MQNIPQTDEQAMANLTWERNELTGKNLVGIYQCRRAQGESVIQAYKAALEAHVRAAGYEHLLKEAANEAR